MMGEGGPGGAGSGPGEVIGAHDLWLRTLAVLERQMSPAVVQRWLRRSRAWDFDPATSTLTVGADDTGAVEWLSRRLSARIERTLRQVAGRPVILRVLDNLDAEAEFGSWPGSGRRGTNSTVVYIKLKVAFREQALSRLRGPRLAVFLGLALHVDYEGVTRPGVQTIMQETGLGKTAVCSALADLVRLGLIRKTGRSHAYSIDEYRVEAYAWFGNEPSPCLWES